MTNFLMDNFAFMDDFAIKKGWFPSTRKPTTFWDFAGPFFGVVSPYQPFFFPLYTIHQPPSAVYEMAKPAWADSWKLFFISSPAIDQEKWGYHH